GPGGYVSAIRNSQLGAKVALVEKYNVLGGTCLNVGCIPSKALLDSSEHFYNATHHFEEHGIKINKPKVDLSTMIGRKSDVVQKMNNGIDFLMKKNKATVFNGFGSSIDKHTVRVACADRSEEQINGKNIIIATGSKPMILPFM